ncbi:MAG TPA: Crp/Fnr family transcriptional regulator [Bacteroidales bacterium]|nr:Crp/Fnr family transcriptional regulator [Bacteroidales bacterium]
MGKLLKTNCFACRSRSDIFNALNDDQLQRIDCEKVSIYYKPGEVIFKQGAPCHNLVCITSGLVKSYLEHENSNDLIFCLTRPYNYLLMPGAFVDQRHHYTAVAVEETTACLLDIEILIEMMKTNVNFASEFIRKASLQSVNLFHKISGLTQKHVFGRMADTILYLASSVYNNNAFKLTISRQELADLSGMTKESAIRVLKKFKDENIISLNGNYLEILNQSMLESINKNG